jgi:pyrrolysine biosynthesis protein PylD
VWLYDIDQEHSLALKRILMAKRDRSIHVISDLELGLLRFKIIVDASPASSIIYQRHITSDSFIVAPGVPHGLDEGAFTFVSNRLLCDPLQLGVAAMVAAATRCI